ncbi:MAG TPA: MarR family transcriptional regulator [Bacillota bacterium]|jgi:DNA-binding MarR family transcriptional regulator|nr:MarR family transcriptional regulator [Bacillota bacterium]HOL09082.1 MarR family transcriptional regulator [Bacillota bacterium]HPO98040.1 MarR family transcriptional regulator [Bacillota bacterium]
MAQKQGGFLISKIHQLAGRIFDKKLKTYNLDQFNNAQGRILFVLWQHDGPISISQLSVETALDKSTLTSMLDRLEQKEFLRRIRSNEDRRIILIELTEKSLALRSSYESVSKSMIDLFYDGFSEKEITIFEECLKRIYANLTRFEE